MGFPNWGPLELFKFERDLDGTITCVNPEPWLHLKSENDRNTITAASFHRGRRALYSEQYTNKVLPMLAWVNYFIKKSLKSLDSSAVTSTSPSLEDADDTALTASQIQSSAPFRTQNHLTDDEFAV
jgi:hypothetical protein